MQQHRGAIVDALCEVSLEPVRVSTASEAAASMLVMLDMMVEPGMFGHGDKMDTDRQDALFNFIRGEMKLRPLWIVLEKKMVAANRERVATGGGRGGGATRLAPAASASPLSLSPALSPPSSPPTAAAPAVAGGGGDDDAQSVYERLRAETAKLAPTPSPQHVVVPCVANVRANYTLASILSLLHVRIVEQIGQNAESRGVIVRVERKLGTMEVWRRACAHYAADPQYSAAINTVKGDSGDMTVLIVQWDLDKSARDAVALAGDVTRDASARCATVLVGPRVGEL